MTPPITHRQSGLSRRDGSALIILLILLSVMAVLLVSNSVALHRLEKELQMLEQKQTKALEKHAGAVQPMGTNAAPISRH